MPKSDDGHGLPPADTGSALLNWIANTSMFLVHVERRFDPFFRPAFDALFRDILTNVTTGLINMMRKDEGFKLAEERFRPDEEAHLDDIIATMGNQMRRLWKPGDFQRGGNTKTHGIVRGEVVIREDLPEHMRRGIFAQPRTYPAWVRFSGPGPYITPDIDDVGFMSISIKLMGVPGPKLLVRNAGYEGQRATPALELPERSDLLFSELRAVPCARFHHAGALDKDPE